jgi:hypothetical protein
MPGPGFRKFTRRSVPRSLSEAQKKDQVTQPTLLLDLLQQHQKDDFSEGVTGDESPFRYVYPARAMYARTRMAVIPSSALGSSPRKL